MNRQVTIKWGIAISILIILLLALLDIERVLAGPQCLIELQSATEMEKIGRRLWGANFIFKMSGIVIATFCLNELFSLSYRVKPKVKILFIYTLVALVLQLPIYNWHGGFGGSHGHSFWNGGFHFH